MITKTAQQNTMPHYPMHGAVWMVLAGAAFAGVNNSVQYLSMVMQVPSFTVAFIQYFLALLMMLPLLAGSDIKQMIASPHRLAHFSRVILGAIGVQLWTSSLAHVQIWQAIALLGTGPFFGTIGSKLFLGESVSTQRWIATAVGFIGVVVILAPWSESFSLWALLPIGAAALWSMASIIARHTSQNDDPITAALYLLIFMQPINLSLAVTTFAMPSSILAWQLLALTGVLTAFAQWAVVKAYSCAQASYVQPFDHVKLIFNIALFWMIFKYWPPGYFWPGLALIVGAAAFIAHREQLKAR